MIFWLWKRKPVKEKKVSELSIGDVVAYPTGAGRVTHIIDEKRIEATGTIMVRFFKMDMVSGPHKGDHLRDALPFQDVIEVYKEKKQPRVFTMHDALAYICCAFIMGSSVTAVTSWLT